MSDGYIWGALNRATNDPTLIDEAIGEALVAHNDDPDAHLGPGQALESHRASEIIDHVAESVVNDKIRRTARRYVAIVDPSSEFDFDTVAGAVQYAMSVGGGDIFIKRGTHYISGSIDLSPTISFYGEGIGETILESTSSGGSGLFYYKNFTPGDGYAMLPDTLDGLTTFNYNTYFDYENPPVVGMYIVVYNGDDQRLKITAYNSGTGMVTLDGALSIPEVEVEAETLAGFALTNSSSQLEVFMNTPEKLDRYYAGMSVVMTNTSAIARTISRTGSLTFELATPWSGSTQEGPGQFDYQARSTINYEGISTRRGTYYVLPTGNPGLANWVINSCENIYAGFGGAIYFTACRFDCNAAAPITLSGGSVFSGCTFIATAHNSRGIQIVGQGTVQNCRFYAGAYSNHRWLYGVAHPSLIIGNVFELQIPETVFNTTGNSTALGTRIIGNYFTFGSSGTYAFQLRNSIITNNSFMVGSSNAPQLNASSANNIFCNNRCSKTPVNNGTSNLMVNNLVVA